MPSGFGLKNISTSIIYNIFDSTGFGKLSKTWINVVNAFMVLKRSVHTWLLWTVYTTPFYNILNNGAFDPSLVSSNPAWAPFIRVSLMDDRVIFLVGPFITPLWPVELQTTIAVTFSFVRESSAGMSMFSLHTESSSIFLIQIIISSSLCLSLSWNFPPCSNRIV